MKYWAFIGLLCLNLYHYQHPINSAVFLAIGVFLIFCLCFECRKNGSAAGALMELLVFTWPISWVNIFGTPTSDLQLPWFYIVCFCFVLYAFCNIKVMLQARNEALILICFLLLLIYLVVPLLQSQSFAEGMKDYVMIGVFCIVLFVAFVMRDRISMDIKDKIVFDIVFMNFICALFIIFQYYMFHFHGVKLFKLETPLSFGGVQTSCSLLFEDPSCSTIMLGCGCFYAFLSGREHKYRYFIFLITLIGLALTSRRTSVICLIIILGVYYLIHYRNVKRILSVSVFVIIAAMGLYVLNLSRPVGSYIQFVNDNGRLPDYISGLKVFAQHPLFGIGYDNIYLASLMTRGIIPHNTVLRWLDMGGIFLAVPLVVIICYVIVEAYRKKFTGDFWVLLYVVFASNLIPDLLDGRFFIILCCMVLFTRSEKALKEPQSQISERFKRRLTDV